MININWTELDKRIIAEYEMLIDRQLVNLINQMAKKPKTRINHERTGMEQKLKKQSFVDIMKVLYEMSKKIPDENIFLKDNSIRYFVDYLRVDDVDFPLTAEITIRKDMFIESWLNKNRSKNETETQKIK
jgi:hypothetical protein